jgi:transposase
MVTWDSDRFARGLTLGEVRRRLWPLVPKEVRESWKILLVGDEISRTLKKGPGCRIEDEVELELGCRTGEDLEHANCPSPPCGTTRRDRLEARRLRAAELFAAGVHQVEVARQLGVSAQAVSVWHRRWQAGGPEALHSRGPSGPAPRLSDAQLATVEQALLEGATANGFIGELWTLERIATVIKRLTGVHHHPAWVWTLLRHRLGWSVQRPKRRAAERDQDAIDRWVKQRWPAIKQTPNGAEPAWSSSTRARSA